MNQTSIKAIKRLAGLIMLVCLFLPLSQCERNVPAKNGKPLNQAEINKLSSEEIKNLPKVRRIEVSYAYSKFDVTNSDSWHLVMTFIWPIVIWMISLVVKPIKWRNMIGVAEFVLCFYSAYFLYIAIIFQEPLIGWYLAVGALCVYFICLMVLFILFLKNRKQTIKGSA